MVRKIALVLLTVIGFHPGVVSALGLGELTLHSSLNEPLNAEIELLQVEDLAAEEILVGLATDDDFERNNVERFHHLTFIRFKVRFRDNGTAYIQVSSRVPIREPYLNFLVDAQWPGGRLLREYTLLLDLPVFDESSQLNTIQQPPVVDEPETFEEQQQQTRPSTDYPRESIEPEQTEERHTEIVSDDSLTDDDEFISSDEDDGKAVEDQDQIQDTKGDEKIVAEEELESDEVESSDDSPQVSESSADESNEVAEQVSETSVTEEESSITQTTSTAVTDSHQVSEYRVNNSDTLWEIARKVRPNRSVSVQQTMLAIQRLNPNAFINNNINLLKRGQVLTVPSLEEIESLNKTSAIQQVALQNHRVTDDLGQIDASSRRADATADIADDSRMKLVTDRDDEISDSDSMQDQIGSLETDLTLALEERDRILLENDDLRAQLTDLEDQIDSLQKLITVKENKLAALQVQLANQQKQADVETLTTEPDGADDSLVVDSQDSLDTELPRDSDEIIADELAPKDASDLLVVETPDLTIDDGSIPSSDKTVVADDSITEMPLEEDSADLISSPDEMQATETQTTTDEAQTTAADTAPVTEVTTSETATTETTPAKPATEVVTPEQPSGFIDSAINFILNNLYAALFAGLLLVAVIVLAMVKMRQAKDEDEDDLDQFVEPQQLEASTAADTAEADEAAVSGGELDLGGSAAFDTATLEEEREVNLDNPDEVIAEADVCMAYGRFDQATYLLSRALDTHQDHQPMRLKLIEVLAETKDETGFEIQESILSELGNDDALAQIAELKKKAFGGEAAGGEDLIELPDEEIDLDISLDEEEPSTETADESPTDDESLEIDFDAELDDEDLNLALDLDEVDLEGDIDEPGEAEAAPESALDDEESLDLDLADADEEAVTEEGSELLDEEFEVSLDDAVTEDAIAEETEADEASADTGDIALDDTTDEEGLFSEDLDFEDLDLESDFDEDFALDGEAEGDLGLDFDLNEFDAEGTESAEAGDSIDTADDLKTGGSLDTGEETTLDEVGGDSGAETDPLAEGEEAIAALADTDVSDVENVGDDDILSSVDLDEDTDELELSLEEDSLEDELADVLADDSVGGEVDDLDLDLSDDAEVVDDDFDFDLEEFALDTDSGEDSSVSEETTAEDADLSDIDTLDFDFDSADGEDAGDQLGDDLDFDSVLEDELGDSSEESADSTELGQEEDETLDGLADDLDFDLSDDGATDTDTTTDTTDSDDIEDFDLDLGLDDEGDSETAISLDDDLLDGDDDLDFLSDTDETATKLDLARAYIDMGDKNGAQDILKEVIAEGSENQQKEAKDLLERI